MELRNRLLPHQVAGVEKLRKIKVGALFMEQGTGKTITALELFRIRLAVGKVEKLLWLCPCTAKENIRREIIKHMPREILSSVIICGIETLSSSIRTNIYLREYVSVHTTFLVVDESLLCKNPRAERTKNIMYISEHCPYRLILNGTPVSRNEADLFSQFYILDWRILGYQSYWSFSANHLEYDEKTKRMVRCLNTDYLLQKIEPYTYQVRKSECIDLPSKKYLSYGFSLTEEQSMHYRAISEILFFELDEMKPETIYRLFSALQAISCGREVYFIKRDNCTYLRSRSFFDDPNDDPRMQRLAGIIEYNTNDKVIIFCNYSDDVNRICAYLNTEYGEGLAVKVDGKISLKQREVNIEKFRKEAKWLVANKACASYSLNLQFCHRIIYYSDTWNLATRLQSEDRVHRIGQDKEVEIIDIYARGTIDERISSCLIRKENLLNEFKWKLSLKNTDLKKWLSSGEGINILEDE